MKRKSKSFRSRMEFSFLVFAVIIFGALWMLQIVFLQYFYDRMVITNVKKAAAQIALAQEGEDFQGFLDEMAYDNSFLIFVTDGQGNILYGTDEHSHVYGEDKKGNPYGGSKELRGWQIGAARNLSLPKDYDAFLEDLKESKDGTLGCYSKERSAYGYGMILSDEEGEKILYINTSLEAVGGTVTILKTQLLWVTLVSLFLAVAFGRLFAKRFSRPITVLSEEAGRLADGDFQGSYKKGFCTELDGLADSLERTARQLSETENFRREFLANITHDLRTPLTMIKGYGEMVRDISWEDEKQREADLSVIIREADRLTGLVNDILEYTSLQSGKEKAKGEEMDLCAVADEVIIQFAPLCTQEGYRIHCEKPPRLMVWGDREQIFRVLYNLVDNAASHGGKKKEVHVVLTDTGNTGRVEVQDFGEGIDPEELPRIWERYFSFRQQKRNEKGSGLGLAISKEILKAHDAAFGVESQVGQGSTFWFELPKQGKLYISHQ